MQKVIVLFALANDVKGEKVWLDIGPNSKKRIDDLIAAVPVPDDCTLVVMFAAGTDAAHGLGKSMAELCAAYFDAKYARSKALVLVNTSNKTVWGTDSEIIWGVGEVVKMCCSGEYQVEFYFGTQRRHMPRVKWIVKKRFPSVRAHFVVTNQTKEIPWWREAVSWAKLYLGDGVIGTLVQKLRRSVPDSFSRG